MHSRTDLTPWFQSTAIIVLFGLMGVDVLAKGLARKHLVLWMDSYTEQRNSFPNGLLNC